VGVITAGMTAFYVFRAMFLTFFGTYRGDAHPHESPALMTIPLAILALLSIGGGFIKIPEYLEHLFPGMEEAHSPMLMGIATGAGLLGIAIAWLMYVARPGMADALASSMKGLYSFVYNKYFVDEFYGAAVVDPVINGSRAVLWKGIDAGLIDGAVNGVGNRSRGIGSVLRMLQSGNIRSYATWVLLGSVLVIVVMSVAGGAR
jgi:NADH-quinone oxidoreductase subunit L